MASSTSSTRSCCPRSPEQIRDGCRITPRSGTRLAGEHRHDRLGGRSIHDVESGKDNVVSPDVSTDRRPLPTSADVIIVGAGLAGLAVANAIQRAGHEIAVLEASDGIGGRVRTDIVDGFRLDRGFQVLLTAYPELAKQLELDSLQLRRFEPGALVWNGSSTDLVGDPVRRPRTSLKTAF